MLYPRVMTTSLALDQPQPPSSGGSHAVAVPAAGDHADLLDQLLLDAAQGAPPAASKPVIQKLNYSHDAMIDLIIANPGISQNAIAARFGYTASWICQVMASDAFQSKLAARKEELVDPEIRKSVELGFKALVIRSMELLREKLEGPASTIPDQLVLRSLEISSRAAGYGAKAETPAVPQEVHNHLHILSENLVGLLHQKKREAGLPLDVTPG